MNNEPQLPEGASTLIDVVRVVLWVVALLGIGAIGIGVVQLGSDRFSRQQDGVGKGLATIVGGFATVFGAGLAGYILPAGSDDAHDTTAQPVDTPPVDAAPPETIAAPPSEPFDWTPVIWIAAVVAALAVLALAGYLIVRTRHRILDRKAAARTLTADFAAAHAVYNDVADRYAEYLADPYAIFTRPLLDDLKDPRTAAFITAFTDAGALRTDTCPASSERVQTFADASRAALTAWTTADQHARAIGMGVQTEDGKRAVRRIRSALDLALDNSAAAGEREAAMATVARLSDGLMTVPDRIYARAKTAIETTTRKQLTS
ncbi:hypothetical protein [Rhodococcoides yunnanense]|jgi:hypothetical protein|uniref:hypothetical protein n=1 Tax=Rhodococcoides yunnanense TaxID=278209 RepID=UPI0022B1EB58|nr:hypothetical protein [Rhodococcus yunnanensis]MCZ4277442.1 hypothetical protein [Rhodococcus yunnanensis]